MTSTKPQIKIVNCETGDEIVRDATAKEIAQINANELEAAKLKAQSEATATAKSALLEKLGITEDEAKLLLG
jgi:hypothetical protein